jgi:hypothetical protein
MTAWMDRGLDGCVDVDGASEKKKTKRYSEKEGISLDGFVTVLTGAGRCHRERCRPIGSQASKGFHARPRE